jgi:hypothetical protein
VPAPAQTVIVAPIPSSSPSSTGSAPKNSFPTHRLTTKADPARTSTTKAPTKAPTKPSGVTLSTGSRVALSLADKPAYRVRHRNFLGRTDPIGSSSGSLDRADSTFTVRIGLGNSGCVSFESINYPGFFLRHQNFDIKLHRRDGSDLFDRDATFCPVTIHSGAALALRSINYPKRFVTESFGQLHLWESGAERALALVPHTVR